MELPREFRFEFTLEDFTQYNLDHDARSGQYRKLSLTIGALVGLASLVPALTSALFAADRAFAWRSGAAGLAVAVLVGFLLWSSRVKSITQATEKAVKNPEGGASLTGPRRVVVDETGIRVEQEQQTHELRWKAIVSVGRGPDHLYLWFSPVQAVVLPRRCFKTDSEFEAFAEAVRSRIKG